MQKSKVHTLERLSFHTCIFTNIHCNLALTCTKVVTEVLVRSKISICYFLILIVLIKSLPCNFSTLMVAATMYQVCAEFSYQFTNTFSCNASLCQKTPIQNFDVLGRILNSVEISSILPHVTSNLISCIRFKVLFWIRMDCYSPIYFLTCCSFSRQTKWLGMVTLLQQRKSFASLLCCISLVVPCLLPLQPLAFFLASYIQP